MALSKVKQRIALEAARLIYLREEQVVFRAKQRAARKVCRGNVRRQDLPSNREVRDQIPCFAELHEQQRRTDQLRRMRLEALQMMERLRAFRPRLAAAADGSQVQLDADIELHLISAEVSLVTETLDEAGLQYRPLCMLARSDDTVPHASDRHLLVYDRFRFVLSIHEDSQTLEQLAALPAGDSLPARLSIAQLERLLPSEHPESMFDYEQLDAAHEADRFAVFQGLLLPLEDVKLSPKKHPEGDALYHSLQVFTLGREQLPYDEEFLLAALLHDVGKGIDLRDPVTAGLSALEGYITPRTYWLMEHLPDAHLLSDSTIGIRNRRRLEQSPDFDELMLLRDCDALGRQIGFPAVDVEDALEYLRELAEDCQRE